MKTRALNHTLAKFKKAVTETVTFEAVNGKENVLKAHVVRDGNKHMLYVLAIPEENFNEVEDCLENFDNELKEA